MALTKEKITGVIIAVGIFLIKPLLAKWYEKWIEDTPEFESFLIKATFGFYRKKARALARTAVIQAGIDKKETDRLVHNHNIKEKIDKLLWSILVKFGFNRVTISSYIFLGQNFPQSPTLVDFENMVVSVTHEATDDNTKDVADQFQNYPSKDFANDLMRLHYSDCGWITVPDNNGEGVNFYGIERSWRFLFGPGILDGLMALSLTYAGDFEMTPDKISFIKTTCRKIFNLKKGYI